MGCTGSGRPLTTPSPVTGKADTFDEITLINAQQTQVYFLLLHCAIRCYIADQTQINDVMSSFTVSTVPAVHPMR